MLENNINRSIVQMDKLKKLISQQIDSQDIKTSLYPKQSLTNRLTQEITASIFQTLVKQNADKILNPQNNTSVTLNEITAPKISVCKITGECKVKFTNFLKNYTLFAILSTYSTLTAILSFLKNKTKLHKSHVIMHGVPEESLNFNNSDDRLYEFCQKGPINALKNADSIIIQRSKEVS